MSLAILLCVYIARSKIWWFDGWTLNRQIKTKLRYGIYKNRDLRVNSVGACVPPCVFS